MALQKQIRHIPFNKGLENKIDQKIAPDGTINRLENCTFRKNGRIDVDVKFEEIKQDIGEIRSIYSVDEDELFAFTREGTYLKKGDGSLKLIDTKNFFESDSTFIASEEQVIHNSNISYLPNKEALAVYQIRSGLRSSVRYFHLNLETGALISKGNLDGARDPVPFVGRFKGFVFKTVEGKLQYVTLNNLGRPKQIKVANLDLHWTDDDTTDLVKVNESRFAFIVRGYIAAQQQNYIDVHIFDFDTVVPVQSTRVFIRSVVGRQDLGRTFGNMVKFDADRMQICTTVRIGFDSAAVEVYEYVFATNTIEFSFAQYAENTLDNEIIMCFADVENQRVTYGTSQADLKYNDKFIYDTFSLLDYVEFLGKRYYLIANRSSFAIIDNNYRFLTKTNDQHQNNYRDIRRTRLQIHGNQMVYAAPRLKSIEGSVVRGRQIVRTLGGFGLHYVRLWTDVDQDREVEKIGDAYVISGTPIRYFDSREVVEYGFTKNPKIELDTAYEV